MADNNMLFATEDEQADLIEVEEEIPLDKYLIFLSDKLLFGVNAEFVVEIITNHTITHLPMVPAFVSGIINLRGQIIPIIDMRLLLGKAPQADNCVIVLEIEGTEVGILVDTVAQMVDLARDDIVPMPTRSAEKLISGMCSLPDGSGTMLVLDCPLLLHMQ
ncbi:MAG: chemotaxis protein CheW [Oscillospiraceae bacterium]